MERIEALAAYLEVEVEELEEGYQETLFSLGNKEYIILTDSEADDEASEQIQESLWAFNADWVVSHSVIPYSSAAIEAVQLVQERLCEGANDFVRAIIEDMDDFISDSIDADGRAHFLSSYDGNEEEYKDVDDEFWYIYRVN